MFAKAKNPSLFFIFIPCQSYCSYDFSPIIHLRVSASLQNSVIYNTILIPKVSVISSRKCDSRREQVNGVNAKP